MLRRARQRHIPPIEKVPREQRRDERAQPEADAEPLAVCGTVGPRRLPEYGVDIDIVLAGSYPGDGKPKPVVFPDPATAAERGARIAYCRYVGCSSSSWHPE
jgi:hypothetical protein